MELVVEKNISEHARALSIIAKKFGYDYVMLIMPGPMSQSSKETQRVAVFGHYNNYDTELLEADGNPVWIKHEDAGVTLKSEEAMYNMLIKQLYTVLESGGKLSDGKNEVNALGVSEFMISCVLNGYA